MKKIISVKEIMIILVSIIIITFATSVNATSLVLGGNNNTSTVSGSEYENWLTVPEDKNVTNNSSNNNNNNNNNTKVYNTSNTTDLPQTGIEDYNIGILLIIFMTSAIFAYRKINDYKNI